VCWLGSTHIAVYVIANTSGNPKLITEVTGWPEGLTWTPDNTRLILSRTLATQGELDEIALTDGSLTKLSLGGNPHGVAISRRNSKLAFADLSANIIVQRRDLQNLQSKPENLISSTREESNPQDSPDGEHIVFESTRTGVREIWMSDADGSHPVQISNFRNNQTGTPHWSPDSQYIVFDSRESGSLAAYTANIADRLPHKLVTNISGGADPSWSHDGRWIYLLSSDQRVFRCSVSGGDAVALSRLPGYGSPLESLDGQSLYFVDSVNPTGRLFSVQLKQTGVESPVRGLLPIANDSLWTPVRGGIYFVRREDSASVWFFDFKTEKPHRVFQVEKPFNYGLSVSSDERWIIYTQFLQANADIMLVDHYH
jgi:dipeptidyl aminopeptidase/acylaminoacyl peptidase